MSQPPVLYSFRRCPFAIRARLALMVNNIQYELREILLSDKPSEMLDVSPKGTVPVLVLSDGQVIDQSIEIMIWAYEQGGRVGLISDVASSVFIDSVESNFKYHLDRYKYDARYEPNEKMMHREAAFLVLNKILPELKELLAVDDPLTFVDYAILPLVRQFRLADATWFDNQDSLSWYRLRLFKLLESNEFIISMEKHPLFLGQKNSHLIEGAIKNGHN
jgi:glutathione S-transferase